MVRRFFPVLVFFLASRILPGDVQNLPPLPAGAFANAVQVDGAGNIYVAGGFLSQNNPSANAPAHAFAAKLSPDGSQTVWWTVLAGSADDQILAMALGSDNSVYVAGTTFSADFPTTPGSLQPAATVFGEAFAAKLNQTGRVVYSTYIGGSDGTTGNAIAVDSAGRAFIAGILGSGGVFPTTPGAVSGAASTSFNTAYVIELDPAGSNALVAISGFGGHQIAVDADGNIYAAGSFAGPIAPTTSGAFQTTASKAGCFSGLFFGFPCIYQHVAKINPTGTQLIYATYVSGTFGATPSGIAVDGTGNVILAGKTNSPDYPTTPGAYQPEYFADPNTEALGPQISAPPNAGYITKVNASGTGLMWSTFFAGSGASRAGSFTQGDSVAGMAIDAGGNILVAGLASSSDLPGLWKTPVSSRPTYSNPLKFVARLSADGSTLSPAQLLPSGAGGAGIAVRADGTAISSSPMAIVSLPAVGRIAAIVDPADNAKIVGAAPGQLLTLYGTDLAPSNPAQPPVGFPTSFNGVTVTFNGTAAPILYTSGSQINLQVPYEITGAAQVDMRVSSQLVTPPLSESFILAVDIRQPSVFLSGNNFSQSVFGTISCGGTTVQGLLPLALNADGTVNGCATPAAPGSVVTLFLNGVGITTPPEITGAVASAVSPLIPAASLTDSPSPLNVLSTSTVPGSIASLTAVQIQLPSSTSPIAVPLTFATQLVREQNVVIWVKSQS